MDHQNPTPSQPYPWYDDRVEAVRKEYVDPWAEAEESAEEPTWYTPREIYNYLDGKVWKQDEAKRAVSVTMYQCLHGMLLFYPVEKFQIHIVLLGLELIAISFRLTKRITPALDVEL